MGRPGPRLSGRCWAGPAGDVPTAHGGHPHRRSLDQGTTKPLADTTAGEAARPEGAKAVGAAHLSSSRADMDLDAFVLSRPIAATWGGGSRPGTPRQRAPRRARGEPLGLRGLRRPSVAWGPWGAGGRTYESAPQLRRRGLRLMDPGRLGAALGSSSTMARLWSTVADVDWAGSSDIYRAGRARCWARSPRPRGVRGGRPRPSPPRLATRRPPRDRPAGAAAGLARAEQERLLTTWCGPMRRAVLGHDSPERSQGDTRSGSGLRLADRGGMRDRLTARSGSSCPPPWCSTTPLPTHWPSSCAPRSPRRACASGIQSARPVRVDSLRDTGW